MEPEFICNTNDHDAWLQARTLGIGGSDAPSVLGLEKAWGSPFSVACQKRGLSLDEDIESELLQWGHRIEGPAIDQFSDETGHSGKLSGDMFRRADPGLEFMQASMDGIVTEKGGKTGGLEVKLSIFSASEWERDGVPESVLCQVQHQMGVMDFDFCYVIVLLDGYKLRYKRVDRDTEILGDIIEPAEKEFWMALQDGADFDAGIGRPDQSAAFLKSLHPRDDGTTNHLEGYHWIQTMNDWQIAKEDAKAATRRVEQLKNTLIQGVGPSTFARLDDGRGLSLKTSDRSGYEVKPTSFRTLRATK